LHTITLIILNLYRIFALKHFLSTVSTKEHSQLSGSLIIECTNLPGKNWRKSSYFDNIEVTEDAAGAICPPDVEGWSGEFLKFIWIYIISNFMHKGRLY